MHMYVLGVRVVVIVQGLVILRWLPLMYCPFPPAAGHGDLHDIGGATVHHEPLNRSTREDLFAETLKLLRGQNNNNKSVARERKRGSVPPTHYSSAFLQNITFVTTTTVKVGLSITVLHVIDVLVVKRYTREGGAD